MISINKDGLITLPVGCSAEKDTCGSCKFFERNGSYGDDYKMNGVCRFMLPAKIATQDNIRRIDPAMKNYEYQGTENWIKDSDRCDLYRPDGRVYIVQRRVGEK